MVDHTGTVVDGDELVFIIARDLAERGKLNGGVVGTLMSNLGMELALNELDIPFVRANVGDRYVIAELLERNWLVGGENSGHILCLSHNTTGDAIIAALQVLLALRRRGETLAQARQALRKCPQVLLNVRFGGGVDPVKHPLSMPKGWQNWLLKFVPEFGLPVMIWLGNICAHFDPRGRACVAPW